MIDRGSFTKGTNEELDEHRSANINNIVPLNELLVNSTVPAATVAVKVCDDSADETGRSQERQRRGILSNFQRRTFSRISFKGETGPLLSRWNFLFFFFLYRFCAFAKVTFRFDLSPVDLRHLINDRLNF